MKVRSKIAIVFSILGIVLLVSGSLAYEYCVGFPRIVDGQWVQRRTAWYSKGLASLAVYRGQLYYYYTDPQGQEVRHGRFREVFANGQVHRVGSYRHGERHGTWTEWNVNGEKLSEGVFQDGKQVSGSFQSPKVVRAVAPGNPVHPP